MSLITLKDIEIHNETELSWLVEYEGKMFWVPKLKCLIDEQELQIPEWMAIEKGMI